MLLRRGIVGVCAVGLLASMVGVAQVRVGKTQVTRAGGFCSEKKSAPREERRFGLSA